jgi:hypothetical protein
VRLFCGLHDKQMAIAWGQRRSIRMTGP